MQSCEEWCVCICRCHTFSRTGQNTWVCLNAITVIDDSPSCHPTVSLLSVFLHVPVSLLHTQEHSAEKGVELNIYLLIRTYVQTLLPPPPMILTINCGCATDRSLSLCFHGPGKLDLWQFVQNVQFFSGRRLFAVKVMIFWQTDVVLDWQNTSPTEYIQTDNNGANIVDILSCIFFM